VHAEGDGGDNRTRGGAGALDRGRGAVVNIIHRLYAKRRRDLGYDHPGYPYEPVADYDAHTYAAAGVAPGDRHEHGPVTHADRGTTEANPASDPDVPGNDRPRPEPPEVLPTCGFAPSDACLMKAEKTDD
jgi:hypothetical protein